MRHSFYIRVHDVNFIQASYHKEGQASTWNWPNLLDRSLMSQNNGGIRDATIERARTDRMTAMHSCEVLTLWGSWQVASRNSSGLCNWSYISLMEGVLLNQSFNHFSNIYQTRVRSLATLVIDSLTDSLNHSSPSSTTKLHHGHFGHFLSRSCLRPAMSVSLQ